MKILVVFYSTYGHVWQMAESVAAGAREVEDADVTLYQAQELIPDAALERIGAKKIREQFAHIPVAKATDLAGADAIIFGTPTRFGNMAAQMRNLLDQTGQLWLRGEFVGKVGSVFCSTSSQHGGQETTITSFHTTLFHLGMIVVGVPYAEQRLLNMNEISGGSPYGASTMSGGDNSRPVSENELAIARFQGKYVAEITRALVIGRGKM